MNKRIVTSLILLLLTSTFVFLTFNMHRNAVPFTFKSEIYGDKAGYYVYLPAVFIYDLDAERLPEKFQKETGKGFSLTEDHKFYTKYSCGVALLQSPFFLSTHVFLKLSGKEALGFSVPYQNAIDIAGVLYGIAGLILLSVFLKRFFSSSLVYLTLFVLLAGTNLYYYMIADTGMSHIYSFFLFASFLVLSRYVFNAPYKYYHHILFGLVIGLIIAVRPLNIIFLPVFFFVRQESLHDVINKMLATPLIYYGLTVLTAFVALVPQFLYWKYISGSFIYYGYANETFSNLWSPKLILFWFSTKNGLFFYTPLFLLILLGLFFMSKEHKALRVFLGLYFIGISYIFASWWCWHYGCGYGSRPFVEYYALFALPLGFFLQKISKNIVSKSIGIAVVLMFIVLNLLFIYHYDGCWYGSDWDFEEYIKVLIN